MVFNCDFILFIYEDLAKMGETELYYFYVRDRKYLTRQKTNRATNAGYWKATGKDKEIFNKNSLIWMKKTMVFYKGRAPESEKTNWVMHEYRLGGNTLFQHILSKRETVILLFFTILILYTLEN